MRIVCFLFKHIIYYIWCKAIFTRDCKYWQAEKFEEKNVFHIANICTWPHCLHRSCRVSYPVPCYQYTSVVRAFPESGPHSTLPPPPLSPDPRPLCLLLRPWRWTSWPPRCLSPSPPGCLSLDWTPLTPHSRPSNPSPKQDKNG